jgi:acyl-CoA hydrolase
MKKTNDISIASLKTPLFSTKSENMYEFDFQDDETSSTIISNNSKITIELDLKRDLNLRNSFVSESGEINLDKLLESLDNIAYDVAYKHAQTYQNIPLFNIIRSCDKIKFPKNIDLSKKLIITGKIIHNGKSSMDLVVTVTQEGEVICQAFFTLSAKLKASGESNLETDKIMMTSSNDTKKQERVVKSMLERIQEMQTIVPTKQERAMIHYLFVLDETKICARDTQCIGNHDVTINAAFEFALKAFQKVCKVPTLVGMLIVEDGITRDVISSKIVYSMENAYLAQVEMNDKTIFFVIQGEKKVRIAPCTYEETIHFIYSKRVFDHVMNQ